MYLFNLIKTIYQNLHRKNEFRTMLLISLIISFALVTHFFESKSTSAYELQEGIAQEIIRFHVIANSDREEDQQLKYLVKDQLVRDLSPELNKAKSIEEARNIIRSQIDSIKSSAEQVIRNEGFYYPVEVSLAPHPFPLKIYGDYSFPPGTYEALRVQIGESSGQNWWCVMFPPLCFVDESYSIVTEESEEQLRYLLTEEEFSSLKKDRVPVKVKFKLFKVFKKLFR